LPCCATRTLRSCRVRSMRRKLLTVVRWVRSPHRDDYLHKILSSVSRYYLSLHGTSVRGKSVSGTDVYCPAAATVAPRLFRFCVIEAEAPFVQPPNQAAGIASERQLAGPQTHPHWNWVDVREL
jgi:hypothetical protein